MSRNLYLSLSQEAIVPATINDEKVFLPAPGEDVVRTNQGLPLRQVVTEARNRNEAMNEHQQENGFANNYVGTPFHSNSVHSKVDERKIAVLRPPQPNGLSTHSQDMPRGDISQSGSSENGLTNVHGTSTLASKLTGLDNLAPTTNTPANVKYLEPFIPASTRLRQIIAHSPDILVCPGVYDGLSARIAHAVGFEGLYMTGAGTTASCLGAADLGIAQLHDMRTNAEMIANLRPGGSGPPLIADMDTGYGGPLIISRALQAYVQAGVAGFHIEDQIPQKRCGHLQGKEVVDIDTYIQRIKACVLSRARLHSDIVIIARTDANQSLGYAECIMRLRRARDEGADMGILEGFASKEQARQAVRDLAPWPLCLNSVENGLSPLISVSKAQEMGFRVVIFSFAALAPAYVAIKQAFEHLMSQGVTGTPKGITPATIFRVCGLDEEAEFDRATGGTAFLRDV